VCATRASPHQIVFATALLIAVSLSFAARAADDARQQEVAQRGSQVMSFDLKATTHFFTKTEDGGVQRVVVKDAADAKQIELIRKHLRDMQARFARGDFSGPTQIHGREMPGLASLESAKPGTIVYSYREVDGGAELSYRTSDATLIAALHSWFDAQVSDHGADAVEGHAHDHGSASMH